MNILIPTTVAAVTGGAGGNPSYPLANVLHNSPEVCFQTATTATLSTTIAFNIAGPLNSVCLLGAVASGATITVDGSTPAGLAHREYDDLYRSGRANHWWTFTTTASGTRAVVITLTRIDGEPLIRAGVLKAGNTIAAPDLQYPLMEGMVDPTNVLEMSDGSIYRGTELVPYRTFSGSIFTSRAAVEAYVDYVRALGGRQTMFDLAPTSTSDRFFLYGRFTEPPGVSHAYAGWSSSDLAITEIV